MRQPSDSEQFSISDVVRILSADHGDVTPSSLRFLEREGLISPQRTEGGHRRYSDTDVERIRFVKEMQRRYFSLSLIKELLRKAEADSAAAGGGGGKQFFRALNYDPGFELLSNAQLGAAAGLRPEQVRSLESLGLIGFADKPGNDEDDLKIAEIASELSRFGLLPEDSAFVVPHVEAMTEEEMRLIVSKVMVGRTVDEMDAVLMRVEELWDELRRALHAKILRGKARAMAATLRKDFEGKL